MIKSKTILLVEDSDPDRLLYSKYLSQLGYETRSFDNCESLIEIQGTLESSLILLDIELPGITGLEAALLIRKCEKENCNRHTLIAITAHNDNKMINAFVEAGFDDYLQKPFMKKDLESKILKYIVSNNTPCDMSANNSKLESNGKAYNLEMFEGEDEDFILSIIQMFITNTPVTLELIAEAHESDDMESLRQHAHKLKPHYSFFGASDVQQTMQQIEDIAKSNQGKEDLSKLIGCVVSKSEIIMNQMKTDFKL